MIFKINTPLARLVRKRKYTNFQFQKLGNRYSINTKVINNFIISLSKLDEMDKFFERQSIPKFMQEEIKKNTE